MATTIEARQATELEQKIDRLLVALRQFQSDNRQLQRQCERLTADCQANRQKYAQAVDGIKTIIGKYKSATQAGRQDESRTNA